MKFLEVFFDVIPAEQDESENLVHYYWTTDENDNILLLKPRVKPNYLIDPDEYDSSEVKNKIDYIRSNNLTFHKEAYIPYTELKQYLEVEVEFKDKIKFESSMRNLYFVLGAYVIRTAIVMSMIIIVSINCHVQIAGLIGIVGQRSIQIL